MKIKKVEMGRACSTYGKKILVGKPKGREPLVRPRSRGSHY
jgi:hypothetical protein